MRVVDQRTTLVDATDVDRQDLTDILLEYLSKKTYYQENWRIQLDVARIVGEIRGFENGRGSTSFDAKVMRELNRLADAGVLAKIGKHQPAKHRGGGQSYAHGSGARFALMEVARSIEADYDRAVAAAAARAQSQDERQAKLTSWCFELGIEAEVRLDVVNDEEVAKIPTDALEALLIKAATEREKA